MDPITLHILLSKSSLVLSFQAQLSSQEMASTYEALPKLFRQKLSTDETDVFFLGKLLLFGDLNLAARTQLLFPRMARQGEVISQEGSRRVRNLNK